MLMLKINFKNKKYIFLKKQTFKKTALIVILELREPKKGYSVIAKCKRCLMHVSCTLNACHVHSS
jgi:hypothetical protein